MAQEVAARCETGVTKQDRRSLRSLGGGGRRRGLEVANDE